MTSLFRQALAERRALPGVEVRIAKSAPAPASTPGRLTSADIGEMVNAEIRKAIQARPVTVEVNPGAPVQTPGNLGEALQQHIASQRRVDETHAAATDRLARDGDPVMAGLYAAAKQQRGADTALANAHAAVADASPVAKADTAIDAAARAIVAKSAAQGRPMSHDAGVLAALNADPSLYDAHRAAHRARRGG